jgi:hypothetical protein
MQYTAHIGSSSPLVFPCGDWVPGIYTKRDRDKWRKRGRNIGRKKKQFRGKSK